MDTMIGKYRVRIKETGLALIHPVGVSFELTLDEAAELIEFIQDSQDTVVATPPDEWLGCCGGGIKSYKVQSKSRTSRKSVGNVRMRVYKNLRNSQRRWRLLYYLG